MFGFPAKNNSSFGESNSGFLPGFSYAPMKQNPSLVRFCLECQVGVSENVVYPIYPMVLLIIIPMKNGYFIGNIAYFQTYPSSESK